VTELHFGTGMGIRNGWELWKGKNRISRFFKSKGITHPDDMSSIILTSFHRDLNNKPIDLEGQISVYQEYWNKLKNKKKSLKQKFKELEIGTVVQVAFSGSWRYDGTDTTTLHSYLYTADDSSDFECLIEGKVIEKIKKKKRYNLTIKITNCDSCEYKNPVFNKKKVETGKTMVVDMAYEKVIIK
jgi:predicted Zn-ribbon and HTH transcriptional regulator